MSDNISFSLNDDILPRNGYINKEEILSYVSEEEIFELVFGFKPREYDYVCSPFRADFSPGAYFKRYDTDTGDKLIFIDWADTKRVHNDCFGAVQRYFNLPNFYQTLAFVYDYFVNKRKYTKKKNVSPVNISREKKKRSSILFQSRTYLITPDKLFWDKYEISKENLLEDKVLPVSKYTIDNNKGTYTNIAYTPCYAYTDFNSGNKKLYFPYRQGNKRFLTNCSKNDIGGINTLDFQDPQLIITKSYKDYRVLKNQGYNPVWFQNEGMIPDIEILNTFIPYFKDIIIFYDNDETGIMASNKVKETLDNLYNINSYVIHLPLFLYEEGIKDPSDLIFKKGKQELLNFLNSNL